MCDLIELVLTSLDKHFLLIIALDFCSVLFNVFHYGILYRDMQGMLGCTVTVKVKTRSSFTHPFLFSDLYDFISSAKEDILNNVRTTMAAIDYLFLCSAEERESYRLEMTRG